MSTLTKLFVLLVSVLAIFLCGLVITFVGSADNWKQAYMDQRVITEAAQVQAQASDMMLQRSLARQQQVVAGVRETNLAYLDEIVELRRQLEEESLARMQAESQAAAAVALSRSQQQFNVNMYDAQQNLQASLQEAFRARTAAEAELISVNRMLNEERALTQQLEAIRRRNEEQLHELEEENARVRQQLESLQVAAAEFRPDVTRRVAMTTPTPTAVPIRGEIIDMGQGLVSISVGSSSGVREGMEMKIIRNGNYMGSLMIDMVEAQQAAGRLINPQGPVYVGDRVTTGFD